MGWGSLGDHYVSSLGNHGDSVGVQKLPVPLAHLTKLELKVAVLVEDLDPVVVGVRHDDLVVLGDSNSTWLGELTLKDAKLSKLRSIRIRFQRKVLRVGFTLQW